ncbi:MAG: glycosyltransferase family 9 protein [Terrimicrobiaceae bacterium]
MNRVAWHDAGRYGLEDALFCKSTFRSLMAGLASNTPLFQKMDKWVGGAACLFCTGLNFLSGLLPKSGNPRRQGLVFVKLAEQGSTVLAGAAIRDAVQRFGRENVYFVVFDENRFILDAHDLIPRENVLTVDTGGLSKIVLSSIRRLLEIRRLRLEALIDLEFFSRATAAFCFLTGIPKRVGFHAYFSEGPWRGNLFTHRPRYNPHIHTSSTFRSLVAALDMPPEAFPQFQWVPPDPHAYEPPRFVATAAEVASMTGLIASQCGRTPRSLVLLNANASDLLPLRRWADANYIELAKRILQASPDVFIAFTGGPDEAPKTAEIARQVGSDRVFSTAGKTTLRELIALYELADVLVTNDSGPAHFATLTGVNTVVLFGPETPKLFGVLLARCKPIFAGLACSPCVSATNNRQTSCRDNVCMKNISVEMVFSAVAEALVARGKKLA